MRLGGERKWERTNATRIKPQATSSPCNWDIVYVQDPITLGWDSTARVINKRGQKFYNIEEDGWIYLKNRRFLRPCPNPPDDKKSGPTEAKPDATSHDKARYHKQTNAEVMNVWGGERLRW